MNRRAMAFWVCTIAVGAAAAYCDAVRGDEPPSVPAAVGPAASGDVGGAVSGDILLLDVGGGPAAYGYSPGYGSPYGGVAAYGLGGRLIVAESYAPSLPDLVAAQREQLIASLQQLQDAYCRAAMLDEALAVRDQIRALEAYRAPLPPVGGPTPGAIRPDGTPVIDDGSPYELRGRNGESFFAEVTGTTTGSVWGDDVYTDDSDLATAAVHAGILKEGETKVVKFTILPGQDSYASSSENGVSTMSYGSYSGSFRIDAAALRIVYPYSLRDQGHERLQVFVIGNPNAGTVWGTDVYTDDSALDAAAVHAGVVSQGQRAIATIEFLAGKDSYEGTERNGVTSSDYGAWQASYRFLPDDTISAGPIPGVGGPTAQQTPYELRGRNGETFTATVTGSTSGSVWGDGIYTDDSDLATAAVHAGVLQDGQTGEVRFTILPGQENYGASERNGVSTRSWHSYGGSFRIEGGSEEGGSTETITVTGSTGGTVWGSGIYTSDSDVGTAAVHAGILEPGETGSVTIQRLPGQGSYTGSSSNGVTTYDYGSWSGSFRFVGDANADTAATGPREKLTVTGSTSGSVWGSGVYTSDSDVGTAAVHAGLLEEGQTGVVVIERLPGRDSYEGSESNGVTSYSYGPWGGSFRFVGEASLVDVFDGRPRSEER